MCTQDTGGAMKLPTCRRIQRHAHLMFLYPAGYTQYYFKGDLCSDGPVRAQKGKNKTLSDGICRAAHGLHPSPLPLCSLSVRFKSHCGCISRWQQTAAIRWLWLPAYWGTWLLSSSSTVACKHHLCTCAASFLLSSVSDSSSLLHFACCVHSCLSMSTRSILVTRRNFSF